MKRFILVLCMLICGTFIFALDFGIEVFADCNVGFEFGTGSTKVEDSKVFSIPLNVNAGLCTYFRDFGVGLSFGGGVSSFGINYALLNYSAGYLATPYSFNLDYFFEIKINEKNRISISPICFTANYVGKGTDLHTDKEIEVNRQINFLRTMFKYTKLSKTVNKVQQGFFIGLGYTWLCETGVKGEDFLILENNHPIMLMIGGKVLYNAF